MNLLKKNISLSIVPLLILAWGIYMLMFFDPFYSGSSDPEFPYLVNGLNCAVGKFNRIGLIEHPGTPFQMFCGISILITYLFSGSGGIAYDVFSRPEHYMNAIHLFMLLCQAALTLAIGISAIKRNIPVWQLLILQASCFFNDLLMWLVGRVNPDRFFIIVSLIFILVYLKHGYENRSSRKFAMWSGTAMALGLATKFNFLPILFLPLLFIDNKKNLLVYAGSGIISFFIFISPIINKFGDYRRFLMQIFQHDGLYGGGESRVLNFKKMADSTIEIFKSNPELYLLLAGLLIMIFQLLRKKDTDYLKDIILFSGFIFIIAFQIILVSKHFKNYYVAPTFTMIGFMFFMISIAIVKSLKKRNWLIPVSYTLPILFIISSSFTVFRGKEQISKTIEQRDKIRNFVDTSISKSDFWFVEPTWESGPHVENALVYGLSYCAHRDDYKTLLKSINPNIITYEGLNESVRMWRVAPASLDSVVATGKNIYLYSTPGRNAAALLQMIHTSAEHNNFQLVVDTVFSDENKNEIIKINALTDGSLAAVSYSNILETKKQKLNKYIDAIKNSPEWLKIVKEKAIEKNIPLDSMIVLDAQYMIDIEKNK